MSDDETPADARTIARTRYSDDESPSEAVVRTLAALEGVESSDLDPLYESIEPEALDALLDRPVPEGSAPPTVQFVASGYRVVVSGDGRITVLEGAVGE